MFLFLLSAISLSPSLEICIEEADRTRARQNTSRISDPLTAWLMRRTHRRFAKVFIYTLLCFSWVEPRPSSVIHSTPWPLINASRSTLASAKALGSQSGKKGSLLFLLLVYIAIALLLFNLQSPRTRKNISCSPSHCSMMSSMSISSQFYHLSRSLCGPKKSMNEFL